jgi:hypothetical protein
MRRGLDFALRDTCLPMDAAVAHDKLRDTCLGPNP